MSDDRRPFVGDEPTAIHRPSGQGEHYDATQMQPPVGGYPPPDPGGRVHPDERRPGLAAPLTAVSLVSLLVGLGLGYLLFSDNQDAPPTEAVTTSVPAQSRVSTTKAPVTSTTALPTSTTIRRTTTSTVATTSATSTTSTTSTGGVVDPQSRSVESGATSDS